MRPFGNPPPNSVPTNLALASMGWLDRGILSREQLRSAGLSAEPVKAAQLNVMVHRCRGGNGVWMLERIPQEPDLTLRAADGRTEGAGPGGELLRAVAFLAARRHHIQKSLHASEQDLTISPGVSVGASTCSTWDRKSDLPPY